MWYSLRVEREILFLFLFLSPTLVPWCIVELFEIPVVQKRVCICSMCRFTFEVALQQQGAVCIKFYSFLFFPDVL